MARGAGLREPQEGPDPDDVDHPDGDAVLTGAHPRRVGPLLLLAGAALLVVAVLLVRVPAAEAQVPGTSVPDCPAATRQAGLACVSVQLVGENTPMSTTFYDADQVSNPSTDVQKQTYLVDGDAGPRVEQGSSVASLVSQTLTAQGVEARRVTFVEVDAGDDFGRHVLTGGEAGAAGGGGVAPVFYADTNGHSVLNFVRAPRSTGEDQTRGGPDRGLFLTGSGGSLAIVVHLSGGPLDVAVTATPVDGSANSFALSCAGCGGGLRTTWLFPDGTTSSDPSPRYTFGPGSTAGSYPIAVAVEDPSDGSFGGGQTYVQVGAAPSASATPTTPGTGGTGHGHHGSTHGTASQSANPHPGHGHGGSATASPTASSHPSAQPTGVATLPPVLPTVAPSSSLYVPATDGPLSVPSSATPTPTPTTTTSPAGAPAGSDVQGVLLTAGQANAPSPGGQVLDVPAPSAAAGPAVDPSFRVDPLVWLGLGGCLLLAAGAASESDRVRRRLRRWGRWARIGG